MTLNVNDLLDERNQNLWDSLVAENNISVEYHDANYYEIYSQYDNHVIYVPEAMPLSSASFTHELLHIDLDKKDMSFPAGIKLLALTDESLSLCLTDNLLDHAINCLNHIKMLPQFLQLGYERNEFIDDYTVNKLTDNEVTLIANGFKIGSAYNSKAVDFYIGKYISVKACPNLEHKYVKNLSALENVDPQLFSILETLYNGWSAYDKVTSPIYITPHSFSSDFIDGLKDWVYDKKIV